jgi:hypothetical protein
LLSGLVTPESREYALEQGAALVLEKTGISVNFESVYPALEATAAKPREGFAGVIHQVGLTEVLQLECLGRKSSLLEVKSTAGIGSIYISEGSIIHAEVNDLVGVPALARLLGFKGGEFKLKSFAKPPRQSLEGQWESLLMEAAQASDEQAGELDRENEAAPQSNSIRRIEEVILSSSANEILYERTAPDATKRVALLDSLASQSSRVSKLLPALGRPDRLEIREPGGRVICLFQAENKTFVRLSITSRQT